MTLSSWSLLHIALQGWYSLVLIAYCPGILYLRFSPDQVLSRQFQVACGDHVNEIIEMSIATFYMYNAGGESGYGQ